MRYHCANDARRSALLGQSVVNGIDYLEVDDDPSDALADRQRTLFVHFLHPIVPASLDVNNVRITGGDRIRDIQVETATIAGDVLTVAVDRAGDASRYLLRLVRSATDSRPPADYDPVRSEIDFSFKAACDTGADCRSDDDCRRVNDAVQPDLDYQARDYASIRRMMLDRLAVVAPSWTDRNAADAGMALVELLAYVGDQLHYRLDAVASEAYLHTARRRVSLRRHARMVDYRVHDGCNARVLVQINVSGDGVTLPPRTPLLTRSPELAERLDGLPQGLDRSDAPLVFETLHELRPRLGHLRMPFYTWGGRECCLTAGATRAWLRGAFPDLAAGDYLIFVEERSPLTGETQDADRTRRHAVRLTSVDASHLDPIGGMFDAPPTADPVAVTEVAWSADDALPFTLWISSTADQAHGGVSVSDVSVALGNVVVADHGRTIGGESLGTVADDRLLPSTRSDCCRIESGGELRTRFRPKLSRRPLTHATPYDAAAVASARQAVVQDPRQALPELGIVRREATPRLALTGTLAAVDTLYETVADLLESGADDPHVVVEVERDGSAALRFGDDQFARRALPGTSFSATYRTGNGRSGNVGPGSIAHVVTLDAAVAGAWNPLPASGGVDGETMEEIRVRAPVAFRRQERAVTPDDYARVAGAFEDVQRAVAVSRWTGSWRTMYLLVDRRAGRPVDPPFIERLRRYLERFRLAGHDLEIVPPRFVSLSVALDVCADRASEPSAVRRNLIAAFSNRALGGGATGLFHPDALTFGQPVYLSALYARARSVPGVDTVRVTRFERQGAPLTSALDSGRLDVSPLEVARLENDPDFPERGALSIAVGGGR